MKTLPARANFVLLASHTVVAKVFIAHRLTGTLAVVDAALVYTDALRTTLETRILVENLTFLAVPAGHTADKVRICSVFYRHIIFIKIREKGEPLNMKQMQSLNLFTRLPICIVWYS